MKRTKPKPAWMLKREQEIRDKLLILPICILMLCVGITFGIMGIWNWITEDVSAESVEVEPGLYAGVADAFLNVDLNQPVEVEQVKQDYVSETISDTEEVAPECPYTEEDVELLAHVIMAEGGTVCSDYVLGLIGSVCINRMADGRFGGTDLESVIFAKGQYETTWNGYWETYEPTDRCLEIASELLDTYYFEGYTLLPSNVLYQSNFPQGQGTYLYIENLYFCY